MKYISEELSGPTVFKDAAKLDFDYVPKELPHRDEQLRNLARIFGQVLKSSISVNAFVKGNVGTGKTVMTKKFCSDFKEYGVQSGAAIETVHVNCRRRNTDSSVMLKIVTHFQES